MANEFNIENLSEELFDLGVSINGIDMESVTERTLKRAAHSMSEMVAQAVVAEDDIDSPADFISDYDGGPGPPMAQRAAWVVETKGDTYTVKPHPMVKQRAVVLNYGYPGRITPNNAPNLTFNVNGVPVAADSVSGPEYTGYWQAAMRRFQATGSMKRFAEEEARREIEDKF